MDMVIFRMRNSLPKSGFTYVAYQNDTSARPFSGGILQEYLVFKDGLEICKKTAHHGMTTRKTQLARYNSIAIFEAL